ncbi:MAG: polysaccharide deacetylase family protein [Parasporobacterium sp.]|nr:polysaccharide deacetylase family protein [Parasporobacterium sp.]
MANNHNNHKKSEKISKTKIISTIAIIVIAVCAVILVITLTGSKSETVKESSGSQVNNTNIAGDANKTGSETKQETADKSTETTSAESTSSETSASTETSSETAAAGPSRPIPPDGGSGYIALTFDDGPEAMGVTTDILDTLSAYGAKATFFSLGLNASYNPEIMQRMAAEGHEIGAHTYDHVNMGYSVTWNDVVGGNDAIQAASGVRPTAFRAPGGDINDDIISMCVSEGQPLYQWSVDTRDWESRDASAIIENVYANVQPGSIILMHNIYWSTAEAVKTIVPELINQGYTFVTCSELIQIYQGTAPEAGVIYSSGI